MSESRVRENRMHGSRRRREETGTKSALPHGAGASRRPYLSLASRRVEFVACTPNPTGAWTAQQARNLLMTLDDRQQPLRVVIHDRDAKFSGGFDHVFESEGIAVVRTPIRAPNANAHAERWVGSVRRECLDRLLIFSRRQLEQVLRVYARHYRGRDRVRAGNSGCVLTAEVDLERKVSAGRSERRVNASGVACVAPRGFDATSGASVQRTKVATG
jgi:hypothetical protein